MTNKNKSEIDKNILIKQLQDFYDLDKYSIKDLTRFLYGNDYLRIFFQKCIDKFIIYLDTKEEVLQLYCLSGFDKVSFVEYCLNNNINDELICDEVIDDIEKNCLGVFYALSNDLLERIKLNRTTDIELKLVTHFLGYNEIRKAIDCVIKFRLCGNIENTSKVIPHNKIKLKYNSEIDEFTLNELPFKLTPSLIYALKNIAKPIGKRDKINPVDVSRINELARKTIKQNIITRKRKGKDYFFEEIVEYMD